MRLLRVFACLLFGCLASAAVAELSDTVRASVLKIRAYHADGRMMSGSAVVVGPGRLVSNAHVTHRARRIEVIEYGRAWPAKLIAHNDARDLCLLEASAVTAPAAVQSDNAAVGQTVYALGHPADHELSVNRGDVVALHPYDGGKVIQVSAPFDYGASGGGLFDQSGRLVGILTFKARAGGPFHFAVPVAWIDSVNGSWAASSSPGTLPFWQRQGRDLPYFLRAASLEANRDWRRLSALAREWIQSEPENPDAARALAQADAYGRDADPHAQLVRPAI
jgi:hypothetical protein